MALGVGATLALTGGVFGTDEYPRTYQGRPIKRISDDYIGIIVLMFAFIGLFSGDRRAWFFAGAAAAALVISYGRYFPYLFRLVYALPVMKGLRVPHKWIFITALCVPVLAGIGADFWRKAPPEKNRRIIFAAMIFIAAMVSLAYASPYIVGATTRAASREVGARVGVLIAAAAVCLLGRFRVARKVRFLGVIAPGIVVVLLAGDLIGNASKFIKYYDYRPRFIEDDLVQSLLAEPGPFRVKLWSESPRLRHLVADALPYHGVGVVDVVMSRRPARYSEVFGAAREGRLPFAKLFQLFNVKYVLSASAVPEAADIRLGSPKIISSDGDWPPPAESYMYEMRDYLPRVYVVNKYEVADRDKVMDVMGRPDFDLRRTVALEKRPTLNSGADEADPQWSARDYRETPHRVSVSVSVDRPAILVLQDFMDPDWRAAIDGKEAAILRANYLMRAVVVPEGEHSVVFTYHPPVWGFAVTLACWIVVIALTAHALGTKAHAVFRAGERTDTLGAQ